MADNRKPVIRPYRSPTLQPWGAYATCVIRRHAAQPGLGETVFAQ